jgi:hypothetical protein
MLSSTATSRSSSRTMMSWLRLLIPPPKPLSEAKSYSSHFSSVLWSDQTAVSAIALRRSQPSLCASDALFGSARLWKPSLR